jgi:hypothetical protein
LLFVISENIASWVSFYFRTSTFENVLYHWSVSYAAFPFTLCRGFFTPQNRRTKTNKIRDTTLKSKKKFKFLIVIDAIYLK